MTKNLEQVEAALSAAVKGFNAECEYLFDFTDFKAHAPTLETMAEVAELRGKPELAARLRRATDEFFGAANAAANQVAARRW